MYSKELQVKTEKEQSQQNQAMHSSASLRRLKRKSTPEYSKDSNEYKEITRLLAVFIGCTNVSLRMVVNEHLRQLIKHLDPAYVVPEMATISKEIDCVFVEIESPS
jgi:predicted membrane chloride channel (bestrophin family)